jgi:hypothetical protein
MAAELATQKGQLSDTSTLITALTKRCGSIETELATQQVKLGVVGAHVDATSDVVIAMVGGLAAQAGTRLEDSLVHGCEPRLISLRHSLDALLAEEPRTLAMIMRAARARGIVEAADLNSYIYVYLRTRQHELLRRRREQEAEAQAGAAKPLANTLWGRVVSKARKLAR